MLRLHFRCTPDVIGGYIGGKMIQSLQYTQDVPTGFQDTLPPVSRGLVFALLGVLCLLQCICYISSGVLFFSVFYQLVVEYCGISEFLFVVFLTCFLIASRFGILDSHGSSSPLNTCSTLSRCSSACFFHLRSEYPFVLFSTVLCSQLLVILTRRCPRYWIQACFFHLRIILTRRCPSVQHLFGYYTPPCSLCAYVFW